MSGSTHSGIKRAKSRDVAPLPGNPFSISGFGITVELADT